MLVSFFAAEGCAETRERMPRVRLRILHEAITWYKRFLALCDQYDFVHPSAAASVQQINGVSENEQPDNAARSNKIEQRRQERGIKEKIVEIMDALHISQISDLQEGTASYLLSLNDSRFIPSWFMFTSCECRYCYHLNIQEAFHADSDEELERDFWRANIHLACLKSVQTIHMIRQEIEMLKMTAQREDANGEEISQGISQVSI